MTARCLAACLLASLVAWAVIIAAVVWAIHHPAVGQVGVVLILLALVVAGASAGARRQGEAPALHWQEGPR